MTGHVESGRLIELAREMHRRAQNVRRLVPAAAGILDVKRRVLLDDARQARRRRPHGPRCDERAGYGFHVCAKDRKHTGDCRCRCGEEFGEPF